MTTKTLNKLNKLTLGFENISEFVVDGKKSLFLVSKTSEFLNKNVPNKANTREFTGNKNKSVKDMIDTLKKEPDMFRFKNLGLRIVASDFIREEDGKITLFFDEDEGIFNGGHTYRVMKDFGRDNAHVNVLIDLALPKEKLSDVSVSLNMSKKVEKYSASEKNGDFQWIKEVLNDSSIEYKEGDVGEYKVVDVLKVANIFKLGHGKSWSKVSLSNSLRTPSTIITENANNQLLTYTQWILDDMWDAYKQIRKNEIIMKNLPKEFTKGGKLLQGISLSLIYGMRSMVDINKNSIPLWKSDYDKEKAIQLCEKISKSVGKHIKKSYKGVNPEQINRDNNFHIFVQNQFLQELNK